MTATLNKNNKGLITRFFYLVISPNLVVQKEQHAPNIILLIVYMVEYALNKNNKGPITR